MDFPFSEHEIKRRSKSGHIKLEACSRTPAHIRIDKIHTHTHLKCILVNVFICRCVVFVTCRRPFSFSPKMSLNFENELKVTTESQNVLIALINPIPTECTCITLNRMFLGNAWLSLSFHWLFLGSVHLWARHYQYLSMAVVEQDHRDVMRQHYPNRRGPFVLWFGFGFLSAFEKVLIDYSVIRRLNWNIPVLLLF